MGVTETIIIIGIAFAIGFVSDKIKPKEYYYKDRIVTVYKKYQCPKYCEVNHHHYVYFDSTGFNKNGMRIDKKQLGERYKEDESMEKVERKMYRRLR